MAVTVRDKRNTPRRTWLTSVAQVLMREFHLIFRDEAAIIFFVALAFIYPPIYSLIYNTEVVRDCPIAVVDNDGTPMSRRFARDLDATPDVWVRHYATSMDEAQELMRTKQIYGIIHLPKSFQDDINRGGQGHVSLYCDMSVMMRYKAMLTALTNVQMETCTRLQKQKTDIVLSLNGSIVESEHVPLGNTGMGIATAILPFILVYVIQQGLLMGIAILHAGGMGRRRRNAGVDRLEVRALPGAKLLGKALAHMVIYFVPMLFALYYVPLIFKFPINCHFSHVLILMLPFLLASSFLGQSLRVFVKNREGVFLLMAFSSAIFVFLTGASWPTFLMKNYWLAIGDAIPGKWAANAYTQMLINGATLAQYKGHYIALWVLAAIYFVIAYLVELFVLRPRYKAMQLEAELDPFALRRRDLREMGDEDREQEEKAGYAEEKG